MERMAPFAGIVAKALSEAGGEGFWECPYWRRGSLRSTADGNAEQGEFDVILQDMGRNKINAIKAVREVTTLGLRDAKELVESAPAPVKKAVSRSEAERAKDVLETAGSTVKVE